MSVAAEFEERFVRLVECRAEDLIEGLDDEVGLVVLREVLAGLALGNDPDDWLGDGEMKVARSVIGGRAHRIVWSAVSDMEVRLEARWRTSYSVTGTG